MVERAAAVLGNLSSNEHFFAGLRETGAVQRLVELLESGPHTRVTEIAAKTLANLAVHEANQTAIRLAGGIPPLMRLLTLKPSPQARIPHINDNHCRVLADVLLSCMHWRYFTMASPCKLQALGALLSLQCMALYRVLCLALRTGKLGPMQVMMAAEDALRRLQVSGAERNAILDTLRYVDGLAQQRARVAEEEAAAALEDGAAVEPPGPASAAAEPSQSKPFTRCTARRACRAF
jgi:hypothetical protein